MTESSKMMESHHDVTPALCRAARGGLGWSQQDLATRVGIYRGVIVDFERRTRTPRRLTLTALRATFEDAGVTFIVGPDGRLGLLLTNEV